MKNGPTLICSRFRNQPPFQILRDILDGPRWSGGGCLVRSSSFNVALESPPFSGMEAAEVVIEGERVGMSGILLRLSALWRCCDARLAYPGRRIAVYCLVLAADRRQLSSQSSASQDHVYNCNDNTAKPRAPLHSILIGFCFF
jgi:hypothetical protein